MLFFDRLNAVFDFYFQASSLKSQAAISRRQVISEGAPKRLGGPQ